MAIEDSTNPDRKTPNELRAMSEDEAKMWLDPDELERWRRLKQLDEQREETKSEWQEQETVAAETLIRADMGELTTDLELFGNDVQVLVNLDREQRHLMRRIEEKYEGAEDIDELTESEVDRLESMLAEWLELVTHSFNGTRLSDLDAEARRDLTLEIVESWGLRATMHGMIQIVEAIESEDREKMEAVEKFRGTSG